MKPVENNYKLYRAVAKKAYEKARPVDTADRTYDREHMPAAMKLRFCWCLACYIRTGEPTYWLMCGGKVTSFWWEDLDDARVGPVLDTVEQAITYGKVAL